MNALNDDDPIVAEIRRFREEYLARFGYDMKLIDEDVKRHGRELRARLGVHDPIDEKDEHE